MLLGSNTQAARPAFFLGCIFANPLSTFFLIFQGLFPVDSDEDEAVADMIVDAVESVTSAMIKWFFEENPAKKVFSLPLKRETLFIFPFKKLITSYQ